MNEYQPIRFLTKDIDPLPKEMEKKSCTDLIRLEPQKNDKENTTRVLSLSPPRVSLPIYIITIRNASFWFRAVLLFDCFACLLGFFFFWCFCSSHHHAPSVPYQHIMHIPHRLSDSSL